MHEWPSPKLVQGIGVNPSGFGKCLSKLVLTLVTVLSLEEQIFSHKFRGKWYLISLE